MQPALWLCLRTAGSLDGNGVPPERHRPTVRWLRPLVEELQVDGRRWRSRPRLGLVGTYPVRERVQRKGGLAMGGYATVDPIRAGAVGLPVDTDHELRP